MFCPRPISVALNRSDVHHAGVHDPSTLTLVLLGLAAALAGWIDAVVGGGGLVQLPALMVAFPSASTAQLLATNKLGSICGTTASSATYLRRIKPDKKTILPLAIAAFVGSIAGSMVASHIPRSAFNPIILIVLIAVGAYTLLKPSMGQLENLRHAQTKRHYWTAAAIGLGVGVYDGALGPGTGFFFVFALVSLLGYAFLEASAKAKLANWATNAASLVVFIPAGAVSWRIGLLLGVANLLGGYVGARTAVAKGAGFVRVVFIVVVAAFVLKIGYDTAHDFGLM